MQNQFFSVRHVELAPNSKCPGTGEPVGPHTGQTGFQIFRGLELLSPAAAREAPAEIHKFVAALAGKSVSPGEKNYGIFDIAGCDNSRCPVGGLKVPRADRGRWELAFVGRGSTAPKALGLCAGQDLCPHLAELLHSHYGTEPVAPSPTPLEAAEAERKRKAKARTDAANQRATELQKRREEDRADAEELIAKLFDPSNRDDPKTKAATLLDALAGCFEMARI